MSTKRKGFIDHVEKYLGAIQRGWNVTPEGKAMDFQVIECQGGQIAAARVFATLGLSDFPLRSAVSQKLIRHELFVAVPEPVGECNIPALLEQLGSDAVRRGLAYLAGEVIEGSSPIFADRQFYAFYVTVPVILPKESWTYTFDDGEQAVFAWLVPITKLEAAYVRNKGWDKFESLLEASNADLVDLDRPDYGQSTVNN